MVGAGIERQAERRGRGREQSQLGIGSHVVERRGGHPHAVLTDDS